MIIICVECNKNKKLRAKNRCSTCYNNYKYRNWYKNNREKLLLKKKLWHKNNPEYRKKYNKKYYQKNKEKSDAHSKEYYRKNRKRILESMKTPEYKKNRAKQRKKLRNNIEWRKNFLKKRRLRYIKKKDKINFKRKNRYINDRAYRNKILISVKSRHHNISKKDIQSVFKRDKVCVYCGSDKLLGIDHIIPISKSGLTIIKNLTVACKSCNSSKNNNDVIEWLEMNQKPIPNVIKAVIGK